jgi:3-phenylpropionate/trans-cinnamate dioxygenase ferredoxin subunit
LTVALVEVARTVDVPEGEVRKFVVGGTEIALVNLGSGEFRAVADECSHAHYFLSEGEVDIEERTIECPKHGSTFDLETGAPRTLPATVPVATFGVKVEGDRILIDVED